MYYLIIQLFKTEYKEDIFLALTSCGIQKGSTFEGQNLDKVLQRDFPLFSGFIRSDDEKERYSLLIMSIVDKKKRIQDLIQVLKEADIDIQKDDILRLVLLPTELVVDSQTNWENAHD